MFSCVSANEIKLEQFRIPKQCNATYYQTFKNNSVIVYIVRDWNTNAFKTFSLDDRDLRI